MDGRKNKRVQGLLSVGLFATAVLPRCDCGDEGGIAKKPIEMLLTLVEVDPCSGAAVPRRIPDDYNNIPLLTDFGSKADRTCNP